jgi:hypothetical protein
MVMSDESAKVGVARQREVLALCQGFWEGLIKDDRVPPEARLHASELLARSAGAFIDGHFLTHNVFQGNATVGDMTGYLHTALPWN